MFCFCYGVFFYTTSIPALHFLQKVKKALESRLDLDKVSEFEKALHLNIIFVIFISPAKTRVV